MPRLQPIQTKFTSGEITTRYFSQMDSEVYKSGCKELTNFVTLPQGPIRKRHGTLFLAAVPGTYGRVFGFPVRKGLAFFVVVSNDGNVYLVDQSGLIHQENKVVNGNFTGGLTNWTTLIGGPGASVTGNVGFVTLKVGDQATRYSAIDQNVTLDNSLPHEVQVICIQSPLAPMLVTIGTTQGGTDIFSATVLARNLDRVVFDPLGNTSIWIRVLASGGDNTLTRVITYVLVQEEGGGDPLAFPHPWDSGDIAQLQVSMPPIYDIMFFTCPDKHPQELAYDLNADLFDFNPVPFADPPPEWEAHNYPRTQCFYQGRWWVGGTPNEPEQFWGSESGIYYNMLVPETPEASDPVTFTISQKGSIEWMHGGKTLLVGSEYGEFIVTAEGQFLYGGDINVEQQSAYGSLGIQAESVGNKILYVSGDGRKIREIGYQWTDEGWVSQDLTFFAVDITDKGANLLDVVYARNPEDQIYGLTADGNLIGATYVPGHNVLGWYHIKTQGLVHAVGVVERLGRSFAATVVDRNIETGVEELYIEAFSLSHYLDSMVIQFHIVPSAAVTGVTHLANTLVSIIIDGALHPDIVLDANGDGPLQWEGSEIQVGLPYKGTFVSLPYNPTFDTGTTAPMTKRWNKLFVRLVDSAKVFINGKVPPIRHPVTPMNTPEPLRTEDIMVVNLGWDKYAMVEVTQEYPLPTMITGIHGELGVEDI